MDNEVSSIFLCHSSKDKPWVRELAERLTSDGVTVWLDEEELNIGDSLIDGISSGIHQMKFVAAVISPNSITSALVQKELSLAVSKEVRGQRVTVLPLLIENCELPVSLHDKLYADFTRPESYEIEYNKLLRAIGIAKGRPTAPMKTASEARDPSGTTAKIPEELRIVGVVKGKTRQDQTHSGLQDYFLQLSHRPPLGWERHFVEAHRIPRHSMWRTAWLEGDCIVVKCALDELPRYHLKDLKQDIETANASFAREVAEEQQARLRAAERAEVARKARDDVLDSLKFD